MTQSREFFLLLIATFVSLTNAINYQVFPPKYTAGIVPQNFAYDVDLIHDYGKTLLHTIHLEINDLQPQYDFHVSIERNFEKDNEMVCSGAIVNGGQHVVTAASCRVKDTDFVRIKAASTLKGGKILGITCVKNHPDFRHGTINHDIAIIRLNETTSQTSLIVNKPGQIPRAARITTYSKLAKNLFRNTLIVSDVPINSNTICQEYGYEMSPTTLCAGYYSTGTSFCNEDHGSPLFDNGVLIGVKSSEFWCSRIIVPVVYTNVGEFHNWIINTIKSPTC